MAVIQTQAQQAPVRATAPAAPVQDEISRTAQEFEAMFLGMVVNEMMKGTQPETMNGGHGEEMFRSLLGDEIGASMAKAGGIGIAETMERAMRAYGR